MDRSLLAYVSMPSSNGRFIGMTATLTVKDKVAILTPTVNGITDSGYNLVRGYNLADDLILQRGGLPTVPVVVNIPSNYALVGNDTSLAGLVLDSRLNQIPSITINNAGIISGVGANSNAISISNGNYTVSNAGRRAGDGIVNTSTVIPKINNTGKISGGGGAATSGVTFSGSTQQWQLSTLAAGGIPYGVGGSFINSDQSQGLTTKAAPLITNVKAQITGVEWRDSPFPNEGNVVTSTDPTRVVFLHVKHKGGDQTYDIYAAPDVQTNGGDVKPNVGVFRTRNFDTDVIVFPFRSLSSKSRDSIYVNVYAYTLDNVASNPVVAQLPVTQPSDSTTPTLLLGVKNAINYTPATDRAKNTYTIPWIDPMTVAVGSGLFMGIQLNGSDVNQQNVSVTIRGAANNRDASKIANSYDGLTYSFNQQSIIWSDGKIQTLVDNGGVGVNDYRLAYYIDKTISGTKTTYGPYTFYVEPVPPLRRVIIKPSGDLGQYAFTTSSSSNDGSWPPGNALVGKATINNVGNGVVVSTNQ